MEINKYWPAAIAGVARCRGSETILFPTSDAHCDASPALMMAPTGIGLNEDVGRRACSSQRLASRSVAKHCPGGRQTHHRPHSRLKGNPLEVVPSPATSIVTAARRPSIGRTSHAHQAQRRTGHADGYAEDSDHAACDPDWTNSKGNRCLVADQSWGRAIKSPSAR